MNVRLAGGAAVAVALAVTFPAARGMRAAQQASAGPTVTVYKNPTCGCCTKWMEHLERAGFTVVGHDVDDLASIKRQHRVPPTLESCHTAIVDAYVVEGHVPADVIQRLLRERPKVAGIAVAGMPAGSPGMEFPDARTQPYNVMAFRAEGGWTVYERR
jgi:hypothetical protein